MISAMSALFRARTGDFDRLYRRHAPAVYRYAFAVLGNNVDAEDVTQQTFMNAYSAFEQGTKPRKPENWLLTIAHNEVRRHFRNRQMRAVEVELDERLPHPAQERPEPSLADVLRALQHLPPPQREALVMREFEGRSYREIGQIMNVSQSALEGLIFRARRSLAEHLEGGPTCDEAEQAVLRRLDRRLPRRDARRLKAHLRECSPCVLFAEKQKRQRALLKGISVMPIPASLFLFRGDPAIAATGLGAGAASAGGSTALGLGTVGGTGIAGGVAAKAAVVAATAVVAGGVSYGVATAPDAVARAKPKAQHATAVALTRRGGRAGDVKAALARGARPGRARPADARPKAKTTKAKLARTRPAQSRAHEVTKARSAWKVHPVHGDVIVKSRPAKPEVKPAPTRARKRPEVGKKVGPANTRKPKPRPKPLAPARAAEKPKPSRAANPTPPAEPPARAPKR